MAIVAREESPRMTYSYDLIERWMPTELLKKAEDVNETTAKEKIKAKLLENKVFSKQEEVEAFLENL